MDSDDNKTPKRKDAGDQFWMRIDKARRAGYEAKAEAEGRTLSGWIKYVCDKAIAA